MNVWMFLLGVLACVIGIVTICAILSRIIGSTIVPGTLAGYSDPQVSPRGGALFPYLVDIQYQGESLTVQAIQGKWKFWWKKPPRRRYGVKVKVFYKPNKKRVLIKGYYGSFNFLILFCFLAGGFLILLSLGT